VYERILVGYVDTSHGADAVALGADLARLTGGEVVLASIVPAVWIEHLGRRSGDAVVHSGARDRAAAALEKAAEQLATAPGLGKVERRLEASSSHAFGLHDLAEEERADLVVLGSSHRGALGRAALGTASDRLLHGAPCAVAVAPAGYAGRERANVGVIAAAFDGSPEAQGALRCAHALAARAGAALHVLTVLEPMPAVLERWVPLPGLEHQGEIEREAALDRQEQAAAKAVAQAVDELDDAVKIETSVLRADDTAHALLDAARDRVDLMVLGSRGYGPVHRTLVGSVSVAMLHAAPTPVLVVPRGVEPA
jgi:nucleotide-binding universal stress UspA family protein